MSSDLELSIAREVAQPTPKKTKKKSKSKRASAGNEDDDPHWAYAPPEGAVLLDHAAVDATPFDYDALKGDPDLEIWLIRVPDTIEPKHLETLSLDPPSGRRALLGALAHKTGSYGVWSVGDDDAHADVDADADEACDGAEELRGLACLFPRRRKRGKLYLSPKEVSRRLVIRARPPAATAPEDHPAVVHQNPPRPSYPEEVLKHAFVPYGARSRQIPSEDVIDVDVETARENPVDAHKETETPAETRSKKRKADGASPKRSKKHKSDG